MEIYSQYVLAHNNITKIVTKKINVHHLVSYMSMAIKTLTEENRVLYFD